MFGPHADVTPSRPTPLTPGPSHTNVFRPETHRTPPATLEQARALAHRQARPYLLWDGRLVVVVSEHQHIETELTEADIASLPPAPGE